MLTVSIMYERERAEDFQKYRELIRKAKKEIKLSDHLLYVTYPLISELKFLLSVTEHIITSLNYAIEAILEYEWAYKKIDAYPKGNFRAMIGIFDEKIADSYDFGSATKRYLNRMAELKFFIDKSTMQFRRNDAFILTSDDYNIRKIDLATVKKQLLHAKNFISKVEGKICQKN